MIHQYEKMSAENMTSLFFFVSYRKSSCDNTLSQWELKISSRSHFNTHVILPVKDIAIVEIRRSPVTMAYLDNGDILYV